MLVDPVILRALAAQTDAASAAIAAADVGNQVSTSADGLPGATTQWAVRMVGQHIGQVAADIAKNMSEMGAALRGAGDAYEVTDDALAGNFGDLFPA